jgi:hypothetical protein
LVNWLAKLLMLFSLISVQAHSMVPHHHHRDGTPVHMHAAGDSVGFGCDVGHGTDFGVIGPEVAPHDELSVSSDAQRSSPHFALVFALPAPSGIVSPTPIEDRQGDIGPTEHPYATGPPGTRSSRAPPASSTA